MVEKFIKEELEIGEDLCDHGHGKGYHGVHSHSHDEHSFPGKNIPLKAQGHICFTAHGKGLEAELDSRFGRAPYFLNVKPDTMEWDVVENPNTDSAQGAGIQSAQLIVDKEVGMLVTGQIGPNAQRVLEGSGIKVITGASGKIKDILNTILQK